MAVYNSPGFRFHPTDEELVCFYLKRKLARNLPSCFDHLAVIDIYKFEPWDLPSLSKLKTKDLEWYFFTVLDKKYGHGIRTNRATDRGYWKTTGKDRIVKNGEDTVGMKKTLVYHSGRAPHGDRTNWVMHEYRMIDEELAKAGLQDTYVACRIFEKSGSGPKNGEKYGAPFVEAEWEGVDNRVDPLPAVDNEPLKQIVPSVPAIDNELLKQIVPVPAASGDDYVEADDLKQELETSVTVGSADPPSNFYYGECSSHPQLSQAFVNDHMQLEGSFGMYDPVLDQPDNMAGQYGQDTNLVQDGDYGELNLGENPLNFNFASDDPDLYFDATGYLTSLGEEYMETNDVENLDEISPPEIDPSVAAMLDEYLNYPAGDISKHISFDSPLSIGCESPIANPVQPFIEQNVEDEANGSSLANKQVSEAQSSNEAIPTEDPEVSSWVSGDTNPFVKQANKLLASLPAAPAFASEFPTKEFALRIHPAAQSSSSAHITAGMISITDITFRGNAMDWMVGKNGGFNTIMSTGFSQTDANSATLEPISDLVCSKAAFVLSHSWVFLTGFSVVVLSLSFKIGSLMYTGK